MRQFCIRLSEGWKYAFAHPEEAVEIITKYIKKENLPYNKAHQQWMLASIKDLIFPSKIMDNFEILPVDNYMLVARQLFENKLISKIPQYKDLYKPLKLVREK